MVAVPFLWIEKFFCFWCEFKKVSVMMINGIDNQVNFVQPSIGVRSVDRNGNDSIQGMSENLKNKNEERRIENKKRDEVDSKSIIDAVDKANKLVLIFDQSIKFTYNSKVGDNYVDIIDNNTQEVIRKIPTEDMRRFLESVANAVGIIVDKKV